MMRNFALAVGLFAAAVLCSAQRAAPVHPEAENATTQQTATEKFPAPPAEEKSSKTQHSITVNGQQLHYTAIAGTLVIKKDDGNGKPAASMFYVAYTLDGADSTKRPITFAFNGGPGSSSVWLHMGALGPRRVALTPEGAPVPPPYHLVDNQQTALAFTDLVFIDPVSTGFSRNAPGEDPKHFHGLEEDLDSVSELENVRISSGDKTQLPDRRGNPAHSRLGGTSACFGFVV
jgi:carboxypeptidase C (cathepsin A)